MQRQKENRFLLERSGLSQSQRKSAMLNEDYFKIDNRSTADLIQFILEFADTIVYYNVDNQPEGTFRALLEGEDTIDIIMLAAYKVKRIEKKYKSLVIKYNETNDDSLLFDFFNSIFFQILKWKNSFASSPDIRGEINRFCDGDVKKVFATFSRFFSDIEGVKKEIFDLYPADWKTVNPALIKFSTNEQFYNRLLGKLLNILNELVSIGKVHQNTRLDDYQRINPQIALLLTYIDLLGLAQSELNQQTSRHLNHYYSDILKINRKSHVPDTVYLFPEIAQNKKEIVIPEGTVFLAGKDLKYVTDKEFIVSKVKCADFKAICRDNLPAQDTSTSLIDFYHVPDRLLPANAAKGYAVKPPGWVVSHSALNLAEGTRKIRFVYTLERFSMHLLKRRLTSWGEGALELLLNAIEVKHSSPEGWVKVDPEHCETKIFKDDDGIEKLLVEVLLNETGRAVAPFLKEFFNDFYTEDPAFLFQIDPVNLSVSNLFFDLAFIQLNIEIDVLGVSGLELQNDYGRLDASMPFMPFGPTPGIGSTFYIGHPTVFTNSLTELFVNIHWFDVPDYNNGFAEHYNGYSYIDNNQVFKCKLSVLNQKVWLPDTDHQMINLFEDVEMEDEPDLAPINDFRGIDNIEVEKIAIYNATKDDFNAQVKKSKSGWMKMELCYPPNGFGNKEYNELIKRSISEGVKSKKVVLPPNEPWVPQMKSISIDYSTTINFDFNKQNKFFHIHPFGTERISLGRKKQIQLLPMFNQGGDLLIGLIQVVPPHVFNLFFRLSEYISDYIPEDRNYQWSVMNGGKWDILEQNQILEDETKGFIQSGYITIDLNREINADTGGILPNHLIWLKLSVKTSLQFFKNILDIRSEAIVAHYSAAQSTGDGKIESNQISGSDKYISGLNRIVQPYASFGGRKAEDHEQYITRVSERLRHKGRSSNLWDYEHIILEEFPEINRVKTLPNTTAGLQVKPGNVLNVVVPNVQTLNSNSYIPAFPKNYLEKIKRHLELTSSPFANIEVVNPRYEEIKLKFNVKFNKGLNYRHYAEVLQQELIRYLNPWLTNEKSQLDFGVSIKGASIIYFIEKLPFVNVITNLTVLQVIDKRVYPRDLTKQTNITIQPSTPISIFISSEKHMIHVITDEVEESGGLEDMSLGNDFIIEAYDHSFEEVDSGIENYTLGVDFILPDEKKDAKQNDDCFLTLKTNYHG